MATVELTKDNFKDQIAQGTTLVDFWASWCGPCKMQTPILEELSGEIGDNATIAKVNVDEQPDLASAYNVMSIPTIIVFKDGEVADTMVGVQQKGTLKDKLGV